MLTKKDVEKAKKQRFDPRLKQKKFRTAVRAVLEDLGVENNMKNFYEYTDKGINWMLYYENLKNPTQAATCEVLCHGVPTGKFNGVDLPGKTKEEAIFACGDLVA